MEIIAGLLGGLGKLFGTKSKQSEDFEKHSTVTTDASTQDLSPELLKSLESLFTGQVGGTGFSDATSAINNRLGQLTAQAAQPQFDVSGFAKGVTDQATAAAGLDLESTINGILSQSGISEGGGSMNALLANKLRNQTAANLAGVNAQATATGEGIRQSQQQGLTQGISTLGTNLAGSILDLIKSTRGASNTGTSKSVEDTKGKGNVSGKETGNPFQGFADVFGSFAKSSQNA